MKKNRIGLSFAYLVTDDRAADDGTRELVSVDLFEVSLTGKPSNPDARVLSTKALDDVRVRRFACRETQTPICAAS